MAPAVERAGAGPVGVQRLLQGYGNPVGGERTSAGLVVGPIWLQSILPTVLWVGDGILVGCAGVVAWNLRSTAGGVVVSLLMSVGAVLGCLAWQLGRGRVGEGLGIRLGARGSSRMGTSEKGAQGTGEKVSEKASGGPRPILMRID